MFASSGRTILSATLGSAIALEQVIGHGKNHCEMDCAPPERQLTYDGPIAQTSMVAAGPIQILSQGKLSGWQV